MKTLKSLQSVKHQLETQTRASERVTVEQKQLEKDLQQKFLSKHEKAIQLYNEVEAKKQKKAKEIELMNLIFDSIRVGDCDADEINEFIKTTHGKKLLRQSEVFKREGGVLVYAEYNTNDQIVTMYNNSEVHSKRLRIDILCKIYNGNLYEFLKEKCGSVSLVDDSELVKRAKGFKESAIVRIAESVDGVGLDNNATNVSIAKITATANKRILSKATKAEKKAEKKA